MRPDYDVVVVGGRVAGASTAMLLARYGHRVLIVERSPMPSDTVSTHAIMRTGVLQLDRWGLSDRLEALGTPAVRSMTLGFGSDRISFDVKPDFGVDRMYAPRRHLFDQMMLDAAVEAGAEVETRTRATGMLVSGGRAVGLRLRRGNAVSTVSARFVVGADGARSRVARLVDAGSVWSHRPRNAVHYAYYSGLENDRCWFQFSPGVNAGLIPTNDGQTLVFVGRPTALVPHFSASPEMEFHRLLNVAGSDLADRVWNATRATQFRGTRGLEGIMREVHGPGWLLVGDAACVKDPISAHGMSQAMRDAELAALSIDSALRDPACEATVMTGYGRIHRELSDPLLGESARLADYQWDAAEASMRMRRISESIRVECAALTRREPNDFLSGAGALTFDHVSSRGTSESRRSAGSSRRPPKALALDNGMTPRHEFGTLRS